MKLDVRPSPIAGQWYPGDATHLKAKLEHYLQPEPNKNYEQLYGLLAPHAGMTYSGPVAGYGFAHLKDLQFDNVVVIGPSHYPFNANLLTTGHDAYQTPLGTIPVAKDVLAKLHQKVEMLPVRDDPEHAIEIELPFLQYLLGDFELIPLAMLDQSLGAAQQLAGALVDTLQGKKVLFVASSDLSHFYDHTTAKQLDQVVLDAVDQFDAEAVIRAETEKRGFACGRGAMATVMLACQQLGATRSKVVHHATSGEVSGDYRRVVGYGAAIFTR